MSAQPSPSPVPPRRLRSGGWTAGWSLKLQINLLVTGLMALFVAVLLWLQIDGTRSGVREEIVAANRVATQLLQRVSWIYASSGPMGLRSFLEQLGRVRANDITLEDDQGQVLWRSPRPTYKEGREAPQWYARLVLPPLQRQVIELPGGRLTVEADPSRAILDGWDDLLRLASVGAAALLLLVLAVVALVGRALRPWPTLVAGLGRLRAGDYHARLPALPGYEAGLIGREVNRLARPSRSSSTHACALLKPSVVCRRAASWRAGWRCAPTRSGAPLPGCCMTNSHRVSPACAAWRTGCRIGWRRWTRPPPRPRG